MHIYSGLYGFCCGAFYNHCPGFVIHITEYPSGTLYPIGKINYERENKRILGATFFGGREVSGYGDLISAFIKTKHCASELSSINYNYTPPLSPMVNLLSILGRKIK